jgi:hypothetical protein
MGDLQVAIGDICGDSTGLRIRVEDVDIYDYVHSSVIESGETGEAVSESGQMSHVAFVRRFTKLSNTFTNRKAA